MQIHSPHISISRSKRKLSEKVHYYQGDNVNVSSRNVWIGTIRQLKRNKVKSKNYTNGTKKLVHTQNISKVITLN